MFNTDYINYSDYVDGDAFESLGVSGAVYLKTDHVKQALEKPFAGSVLITHNSDINLTDELVKDVWSRHPHLKAWFGQNVRARHPKLCPIPLGLERARWFPEIGKKEQLNNLARAPRPAPSSLCLANFSLSTNRAVRSACARVARAELGPYATSQVCETLPPCTFVSYRSFLQEILRHKFVLCPEGNGLDTHRQCETLYLGRIPVVTRSAAIEAFASLPMVILESWSELSCEVLENYEQRFRQGKIAYDLEKLCMSYWKKRISRAAT